MRPEADTKGGGERGSVLRPLLYLVAGPLAWSGHLFLVYAVQSVSCALRVTGVAAVDPLLVRTLVLVASALAAAALLVAIRFPGRIARVFRAGEFLAGGNGAFMVAVMRMLAVLSLAGVLWAGAAAFWLEACPQLR